MKGCEVYTMSPNQPGKSHTHRRVVTGALKSNESRPHPMKSPEVDAVPVKRPLDDQMYAFEISTPVVQQDAFGICGGAAGVAPVSCGLHGVWRMPGLCVRCLIKVESLNFKDLDTPSPKADVRINNN